MICDITNSLAANPGPVFSVQMCDLKKLSVDSKSGCQACSVLQFNLWKKNTCMFIDRVRVSSCQSPLLHPDVSACFDLLFLEGRGLLLPDIVVFLNVNLVKHHVLLLGIYVRLHLHGNMARKH